MERELLKRAREGENVLDKVLELLLPNQADEIKKAAKEDMPILIYNNSDNGLDSLLYHALKNAGVTQVPSYHIMRDNGGMEKNCVFLTVYLNEKPDDDLRFA